MAGELVLITGATGHVGFRVLRYALEFGYKVRAAVRSEAKAEIVRSNAALKALKKDDHLSFVVVPDITADHAYDEAVKDAIYIIHVASPLGSPNPNDDLEKVVVEPAIRGTMNILEAARRVDSVKRIVITSSTAAIFPGQSEEGTDRITAEHRLPTPTGPFTTMSQAYPGSKISALNRAEAWVKEEKPKFDLIHIHPSYVEGRNDLTASTKELETTGTNAIIIKIALGVKSDGTSIITTYLDDTAWLHVKALDPSIPGNQSYLSTNSGDEGRKWNDAREIVARHFPDAVREGILPNDGDLPSTIVRFDASKTEETFKFKFASYETQVVSIVGHYLELYRKEKGQSKN